MLSNFLNPLDDFDRLIIFLSPVIKCLSYTNTNNSSELSVRLMIHDPTILIIDLGVFEGVNRHN